MSVDSAKAFLKKMAQDSVLRAKVDGATDNAAREKIAQEAGFSFSKEELDKVIPGASKLTPGAELSDADLEAVAGGRTVEWVGATAGGVGAAAAAGAAAA